MDTSSLYPCDDSMQEIKLDLSSIKSEIRHVQEECSRRGLYQTSKWLSEINYAIRTTPLPSDYSDIQPLSSQFTSSNNRAALNLCSIDNILYQVRKWTLTILQNLILISRSMTEQHFLPRISRLLCAYFCICIVGKYYFEKLIFSRIAFSL